MIDLRSKFGPVEKQGGNNACVAHAATSVLEAVLKVQDLSRYFVYWNARALSNQTHGDFGCQPRNAMKGISVNGACPETVWPYVSTNLLTKPSAEAYSTALSLRSRIASYQSVKSLDLMKTALTNGLPVMFAFMVPDTFVSVAKPTGFQPMWNSSTKWIGSHAVVACGFNVWTPNSILCRNSFGNTWGKGGYFEMDEKWFQSGFLAGSKTTDAWTIVPV